jgi:hypothetical protein
MTSQLWTVLRSGGEYSKVHVAFLKEQLARVAPDMKLVCLSDQSTPAHVTIPLRHGWKGWWSKMALFAPDIGGDILYCDLDTLLVGDLSPLAALKRTTVLRDFYADRRTDIGPNPIGSGLMFLTEADRAEIWKAWFTNPGQWMTLAGRLGDQFVIGDIIGGTADRFQDVLQGKVCSYKAHIRDAGLSAPPPGTSIVCFHGRPRPWACSDAWVKAALHGNA